MKFAKWLIPTTGLLALAASGHGLYNGSSFIDQLLGIVCGTALIWGYFTMDKINNTKPLLAMYIAV